MIDLPDYFDDPDAADVEARSLIEDAFNIVAMHQGTEYAAEWIGGVAKALDVDARTTVRSTGYRKEKISARCRRLVYERDDFTCRYCGARSDLTVDHIHPEVLGGTTTLDNLQTLCRSCNCRKGARV